MSHTQEKVDVEVLNRKAYDSLQAGGDAGVTSKKVLIRKRQV